MPTNRSSSLLTGSHVRNVRPREIDVEEPIMPLYSRFKRDWLRPDKNNPEISILIYIYIYIY